MKQKYTIAILGIGGVGGFIGGKLAAAYGQLADVEIVFIARGSNAQAIRENGLKLVTDKEEIIARPNRVVDAADNVGPIDLLVCCTKTYDLENSISSLSSSITTDTLILPLLNGVDSTERLQALLPQAKVLQGCIYLVSKIIELGVVQQRGEFYSVHFGGDGRVAAEVPKLLDLLQKADINAIAEDNIHEKIWSKFAFISPIATYTSARQISIGKILESPDHTAAIKQLMTELLALAKALQIDLPADTVEKNLAVMARLPYEATSSMHADFANNKPTELETLTGFIVKKAAEQGVKVDAYEEMYGVLKARL